LGDSIKSLGDFKVTIRLHREVTAHVTVKVLAETEEEAKTDEPAAAEPAAAELAAEEAAAE
jgi:hypothetical protein